MKSLSHGLGVFISWRTLFLAAAAMAAALGFSNSGRTEELRLIEVDAHQRSWMNEAQIFELSEKQHAAGKCGGFMDVTDTVARGADALTSLAPAYLPLDRRFKKKELSQRETVEKLMGELSAQKMTDTIQSLSNFPDRFYSHASGKQSAQWLFDEYTRIGRNRKDIHVNFFSHKWAQPSIIARIEGKTKPDEIVVIGGHQDSINRSGRAAPGADDDASGTATVLEIFRVLAESGYQPERSIEFMAYAAEEVGLRGSQDIAMKYRQDQKTVISALQFDMTMFPGTRKDPKITFITDYVNAELTEFTKKLVDSYVKVAWSTDQCGYACSDHASWDKFQYASAFPFEAAFDDYNHNIHSERDTIDILDSNFGLSFAKLGLSYVVELAATN